MRDPIRQLRELPWAATVSAAGVTVLLTVALEALLIYGLLPQESFQRIFATLFSPPLGQVVLLLLSALVGALALTVFERLYGWIRPNIATLWALIASVVLVMFVRSLFQNIVPMALTGTGFDNAMGIAIGIFWKGKPYW